MWLHSFSQHFHTLGDFDNKRKGKTQGKMVYITNKDVLLLAPYRGRGDSKMGKVYEGTGCVSLTRTREHTESLHQSCGGGPGTDSLGRASESDTTSCGVHRHMCAIKQDTRYEVRLKTQSSLYHQDRELGRGEGVARVLYWDTP